MSRSCSWSRRVLLRLQQAPPVHFPALLRAHRKPSGIWTRRNDPHAKKNLPREDPFHESPNPQSRIQALPLRARGLLRRLLLQTLERRPNPLRRKALRSTRLVGLPRLPHESMVRKKPGPHTRHAPNPSPPNQHHLRPLPRPSRVGRRKRSYP